MAKPKSFTDPARTTPVGMLRYAIEFYAAAIATDAAIGDIDGYEITAPTPVNYLMEHAIELGLKAYLLQQGVGLDRIHKIGHRLRVAYDDARRYGLDEQFPPEAVDICVLDALDALYSDEQFEYIETGPKTFPVGVLRRQHRCDGRRTPRRVRGQNRVLPSSAANITQRACRRTCCGGRRWRCASAVATTSSGSPAPRWKPRSAAKPISSSCLTRTQSRCPLYPDEPTSLARLVTSRS
jgi:hypothetical protein